MKLAIDVMGSDHPLEVSVTAARQAVHQYRELQLVLVGDGKLIENELGVCPPLNSSRSTGRKDSSRKDGSQIENSRIDSRRIDNSRIDILHAEEVVKLDDKPSSALRHKRKSSMHLAIEQVSLGNVDACVSCGNTGALMAIGRHTLKTLPGIDRPAIIKAIPSMKGHCYLLDLGANISCDANNLLQFAVMGSLMCGAVEGIEAPKVGLLNIGEEEIKGEDQVKLAADLLKENPSINYIGFVEGDGIYQTDVDVIVCDGWVGNIALKTSEGLAKFAGQLIEEAFAKNPAAKAAGLLAHSVLAGLKAKLQPDRYNGASFLGLNGIVIKSHSKSTVEGMYQSIKCAMREVEQNIPGLIEKRLSSILVS